MKVGQFTQDVMQSLELIGVYSTIYDAPWEGLSIGDMVAISGVISRGLIVKSDIVYLYYMWDNGWHSFNLDQYKRATSSQIGLL